MNTASTPSSSRRRLPSEPFEGARRVVLEQAEVFSAGRDFVMPSLGDISPEVTCGTPEHTRVDREYYDTDDMTLAVAGIALRHDSHDQDWTVVLPVVPCEGEPIRREAHYPGTAGTVPDEVRRLLHVRLRGKAVVPVARVVTRRVTTPLLTASGMRLAEVVDEHVFSIRNDGREAQVREIDVQVRDLDGVGRRVLHDLNTALVGSGCRLEPPMAETERAFGPAADRS